jgi:ribosomal protein S18 acetylase RimI-like enzyme
VSHIRLRDATPADDAFFRRMEFETTWHSLTEEDRQRLRPDEVRDALHATHELLLGREGTRVVVAETEEGEPAGLLWFGTNRNLVTGEDEAWVYNVSVVQEHRGEGIGKALMQHAERLAREGGFPALGLMVSAHNSGARALYEKLEFRTTNYLMRKVIRNA